MALRDVLWFPSSVDYTELKHGKLIELSDSITATVLAEYH